MKRGNWNDHVYNKIGNEDETSSLSKCIVGLWDK